MEDCIFCKLVPLKMECVCGHRKKIVPQKTSWLLITLYLLQTQFLLTFAQGRGPGTSDSVTTYNFEVEEEKPPNTLVGTIETISGLKYKFSDQPSEFSIDDTTGQIRTASVIDRELLEKDIFVLYVQSTPSPRHFVEVNIKVTDINDNYPVFERPVLGITFSENDKVGSLKLLDTATDRDIGINDITSKYQIESGNEEGKFRLIVSTEASIPFLYLENTAELDREVKDFYQLRISAKDDAAIPKVGYQVLNISVSDHNDNPPIFDESEYSTKVNETVPPGTPIIQVRATDADTGSNADISYRITNDDAEQFAVERKTGIVTTLKKLECKQTCDVGSPTCDPDSCVITVEASDNGQPQPLTGRAYITVHLIDQNDHDPVITFRYIHSSAPYAIIDEGAKVNSPVAFVTVVDKDEGPNGQTSIVITKGNELGHFKADSTLISEGIFEIQVASKLDREVTSKYNLTITAMDFGEPVRSSVGHLVIIVNDTNDHEPVFKQKAYFAELSELTPVGSYVASVTASDNDTGINAYISYHFVSGNDQDWFNIDRNSGLVTTGKPLDRETISRVILKVEARDGASSPYRTLVNLEVRIWDENDETPSFSATKFIRSVSESDSPGTEIISEEAVDNDQGRNGTVHYSFSSEVDPALTNMFQLDSTTGRITTLQKIDREEFPSITLILVAKDQALVPLSSTAVIEIHILDINDNSPVFYPLTYYATVKEFMPSSLDVVRVKATDPDLGVNGEIEYRISSGDQQKFTIDSQSGTIKTKQSLNKQEKTSYQLIISAQDKGAGRRKAMQDAVVQVNVASASDAQPVFGQPEGYTFSIIEDGSVPQVGRSVGKVTATVSGSLTGILYAVTGGDPTGVFTISSASGVITTKLAIDHEKQAEYRLTVSARKGSMLVETGVTVRVEDINDNPPEYAAQSVEIYVEESKPIGSIIYNAEANDKDSGDNADMFYKLAQNSNSLFTIGGNTGVITLAKPLVALSGQSFTLTVSASNIKPPNLGTSVEIKVHVTDVNDHAPLFEQSSYDVSVVESTAVNELFYTVSATDQDLGLNGIVTYSVVKGNSGDSFGMFPDGKLYIANQLDREFTSLYNLVVSARDMGTPSRSTSVNVTIHIMDSNDNAPVFAMRTFTFSITEEVALGSYVGTVKASDQDMGRNAEISFKIKQPQSLFQIHPKSGIISTKQRVDRENMYALFKSSQYDLTVIASDGGNPSLSSEAAVSIKVTDVNDNAPAFAEILYTATVAENVDVGRPVIQVVASDADMGQNSALTYAIVDGDAENKFEINESSGVIAVNGVLDREKTEEYILTILASDQGEKTLNSTAEVKIVILDHNDSPPKFIDLKSPVNVSESARIGKFISLVSAVDNDLGNNGSITYDIASGNPDLTFSIDANTGKIYLTNQLDYEKNKVFALHITASDNGVPALKTSAIVVVNVEDFNDNSPVFPSDPIVKQIFEGLPRDSPVTTITATDKDSGINKRISYKLLRQIPPGPQFAINPNTGEIYVDAEVDRELADNFKLTVEATDQAFPESMRRSAEKSVTIIVKDRNDNVPKFVSMDCATIVEGSPPNSRVTQVMAVDPDLGLNGRVTYELTGGDTSKFRIDSSSGDLFLRESLDPSRTTYSLTVQARDQGTADLLGQKSTVFTLTVLVRASSDNGPTFSESVYSGQIAENQLPGTSIARVLAGQQGSVEFYLTGVTSNSIPQQRFFQVDRVTGVVSTTERLDREGPQITGTDVFQAVVFAAVKNSPTGPQTRSTQVTITLLDENDTPPKFSTSLLEEEVSEDAVIGHLVAVVTATDPDKEGSIEYTISAGNDGGFEINQQTGRLTVLKSLDRETRAKYLLQITASDGKQSSSCDVKVKVTDVNDETPTFQEPWYSFETPEGSRKGSIVGHILAADGDSGHSGDVLYTWVTHWGADKFDLHSTTGVIVVKTDLDYEQVPHYILIGKASDRGNVPLTSTVTVYLNIIDENDNTPIFDPSTYSDEVWESAGVGTSILTVSATDRDTGNNGKVRYALTGGDPSGQFQVDAVTGVIRTTKPLDRETQAYYNLAISASDQADNVADRLHSTVMVSVILKDNNDNSPMFISPNTTSVKENSPVGTPFYKIDARDPDEKKNGEVSYQLRSNPGNKFRLNSVDGTLEVNGDLDRETVSQYTLSIAAVDKAEEPLSTLSTLTVLLEDDNDHSPVFNPISYSKEVSEDIKVGTSLLAVTATDVDIGINGEIHYIITAGDDSRDFYMDPLNGILRVQKPLDFELKKVYNLEVTAQDLGVPPRSDTASVTIAVEDVNDCSPVFVNSPYIAYVQENTRSVPVHVMTVSAIDPDSAPFSRLTYSMEEGDFDVFSVNATSGEIRTLKSLDREDKNSYHLKITAEDSGVPARTGTGTVTIYVQDANDNAPVFQQDHYVVHLAEDATSSSLVLQVHATDKDEGKNAHIQYAFEKNSEVFQIDPSTGSISTKTELDREMSDIYKFTVLAVDGGTLEKTGTAAVTVLLDDVNEHPPIFEQPAYKVNIKNPTLAGSFIVGTTATDKDAGLNGEVVYSLAGGDVASFHIDSSTGVITCGSQLTGRVQLYRFSVRASDKGKSPLVSETSVEVSMLPADTNNFPSFTSVQQAFSLPEDKEVGHVVQAVSATSSRPGAIISYNIAGGNVGYTFTITTQGQIKLSKPLDYETRKSYTLWIEARDNLQPSLSSYYPITVTVTDINDNKPEFSQNYYNVSLMEGEFAPQTVIKLHSKDLDSDANGRIKYSIKSGNEANMFRINPDSGEIITTMQLDRESVNHFSLKVEATDQGSPQQSSTVEVDVVVLDKNDEPPKFSQHFITRIPENSPIGTFVLRITSTDNDLDYNSGHTYSLTSNVGNKFAIEGNSGNITVAGDLDRETKDVYILQVTANNGAYQASTAVTIDILDMNDFPPEFAQPSYHFKFTELQLGGATVGSVRATDRDAAGPNAEIYYSLKVPSKFFMIDMDTGVIKSQKLLEYKGTIPGNTHMLYVLASDRGDPPQASEVSVRVEITPANKHAPIFEKAIYEAPVAENAVINTKIIQVVAKDDLDVGKNAEIQYSIVEGSGRNSFDIDEDTGSITLASLLQGKAGKTLSIMVKAEDLGEPPKTSLATVNIPVAEINRYTPTFTGTAFETTVPENKELGVVIASVSATDKDVGRNGQVTYHITAGNNDGKFQIGLNDGYLKIDKPLDYEIHKVHHMNITARDSGLIPRQTSQIFSVYVTDFNDNPPVFGEKMYEASVPENAPTATSVFTANATDADQDENAIIQYFFVQPSDKFNIARSTGIITSRGTLDYESQNQYLFTIKATNPATSFSATSQLKIQVSSVNEYAPKFTQRTYDYRISESDSPGIVIGSVRATDDDLGKDGIIEYYLVADSNLKGFMIDKTSGEISIEKTIDREATSTIMLQVLAKNSGPIVGNDTDICEVRINVRDANDPPKFTQTLYEASIPENAKPGASVTRVSAVDNDQHPEYRAFAYHILEGNNGSAFQVEPSTGVVTSAALLDRETIPEYNVVIGAIDTGTPPKTGTTKVRILLNDVNDNGPHFEPKVPVGYITENRPAGAEVGIELRPFTFDLDLPPNQGPYKYRLVNYTEVFEVDEDSGRVQAKQMLNRERKSIYFVKVEVKDGGSGTMTSTLTFKIKVADVNDSPSSPRKVEVLVQIPDGKFSGGKIADVHPNDLDEVGNYTCSIISQTSSNFNIPQGCSLLASSKNTNVLNTFRLNVSGYDGIHNTVYSDVTVKFQPFDSSAARASGVLVTVEDSEVFSGNFFTSFVEGVKRLFVGGVQPIIISMSQKTNDLQIYLIVKQGNSYIPQSSVSQTLIQGKSQLETRTGATIKSVEGDNVCDSNACMNGGFCTSLTEIGTRLVTVSSEELIVTSMEATLGFKCACSKAFTGARCETPINACLDNGCLHGGTCVIQNQQRVCICPRGWSGRSCDTNVNECEDPFICLNGGVCVDLQGSYRCNCKDGFSGPSCETSANPCQPSPCYNNGLCIPDGLNFRCQCKFGERGEKCEIISKSFEPLSYMEYDLKVNKVQEAIIVEFATLHKNALVVFSHKRLTGDFIALEIIDGKARFSFGMDRNQVYRVTAPKAVNDGKWYRVYAHYNGVVGVIRASTCPSGQSHCDICADTDQTCSATVSPPLQGMVDLGDSPVFVGGYSVIQDLLMTKGLVSTHDFVGCMRQVQVDGRNLFGTAQPKSSQGIGDKCSRAAGGNCAGQVCGNGLCVDEWDSHRCECPGELSGPTCNKSEESFSFGADAVVQYKVREDYRRNQLLNPESRRKRAVPQGNSKMLSVSFKTNTGDGILLYCTNGQDHSLIHTDGSKLRYESLLDGTSHTILLDLDVTDGTWHNASLLLTEDETSLSVDDNRKSVRGSTFDPLGLDVIAISIGGADKSVMTTHGKTLQGFSGCVSEFRVNGKKMPFSGKTAEFEIIQRGSVQSGCEGVVGASHGGLPIPLPVIIVIVVFGVILLAIVITFLLIRMQRNKKNGSTSKQNGSVLSSSNGPILDKVANDSSRSNQDSGYMENSGNSSEEAIIRQHIENELASKKYNEREVVERHWQKPDIIAPDISGRSRTPISIDESLVGRIGIENGGYLDGPPEHYDIDNASSIAPSDLADIVGHYRRYRKGTLGVPRENGPSHYPSRHSPDPLPSARGPHMRDSPANFLGHRDSPHSMQSTPLSHQNPAYHNSNHMSSPNHLAHRAKSPYDRARSATPLNQLSRKSPANLLNEVRASPMNVQSVRSTPISIGGLYSSNASSSSAGSRPNIANVPPGSRPVSRHSRPNSRSRDPAAALGYRATPTKGLTVDEVARLNSRHRPSPISSADILSTSTEDPGEPKINRTDFTHSDLIESNGLLEPPDTTSEDSSNDSFTCSEVDVDNERLRAFSPTQIISRLNAIDMKPSAGHKDIFSGSDETSTIAPSEDSFLPTKIKHPNGTLNIEYFVNWGTNFEKLVDVFKDIALLPDIKETDGKDSKVENVYSGEYENVNNVNVDNPQNLQLGPKEEYV